MNTLFGLSANAMVVILLAGWALFLFGGFVFGKLNSDRTHRIPTWCRMASSVTLVVLAWSLVLMPQTQPGGPYALLMAVGMTLGCIGDFFMANLVPIKEPVLGGIASFALGHIAYIVALIDLGDRFALNSLTLRLGTWLVWLVIGLAGWYFVVFRGQKPTVLHYAALPYALLLASTAGFATGLALQSSVFISVALGAALFLLSDLMLAAQLFNHLHFKFIGDVVWFLYGPAQMLMVASSVWIWSSFFWLPFYPF